MALHFHLPPAPFPTPSLSPVCRRQNRSSDAPSPVSLKKLSPRPSQSPVSLLLSTSQTLRVPRVLLAPSPPPSPSPVAFSHLLRRLQLPFTVSPSPVSRLPSPNRNPNPKTSSLAAFSRLLLHRPFSRLLLHRPFSRLLLHRLRRRLPSPSRAFSCRLSVSRLSSPNRIPNPKTSSLAAFSRLLLHRLRLRHRLPSPSRAFSRRLHLPSAVSPSLRLPSPNRNPNPKTSPPYLLLVDLTRNLAVNAERDVCVVRNPAARRRRPNLLGSFPE